MDVTGTIFPFKRESENDEDAPKKMEKPHEDDPPPPDAERHPSLWNTLSNSTEGVVVAWIVVICSLVYFYWTTKGMCRLTQGDGFLLTTTKHILNYMTAGVVGVTVFFAQGDDCGNCAPPSLKK